MGEIGGPKRFKKKFIEKTDAGWLRDVAEGYFLMRKGKDYVNKDKRYERAHDLFSKAFLTLSSVITNKNAKIDSARIKVAKLDMARLQLWIGITLQENCDYDVRDGGPQKRNKLSMVHYKLGLKLTRDSRVRMSLYNSLGVACQGGLTICKKGVAINYYEKAMNIYRDSPDDVKKSMEHVMHKVEQNSGYVVMHGGSSQILELLHKTGGNCKDC